MVYPPCFAYNFGCTVNKFVYFLYIKTSVLKHAALCVYLYFKLYAWVCVYIHQAVCKITHQTIRMYV